VARAEAIAPGDAAWIPAWEPWLPVSALGGGTIGRLLGEAVSRWSDCWLVDRERVVIGAIAEFSAIGADGAETLIADDGLAIRSTEQARIGLARLMLGASSGEKAPTAADRDVLRQLAERCLNDLRQRLAAALGFSGGEWRTEHEPIPLAQAQIYPIGIAGKEPLLELTLSRALAVRAIKRAAAPGAHRSALRPLSDALAGQEVAVSAALGRSELSLNDLAALAPGDVLVLDRDVGAPAPLAVNGTASGGRATIEEAGGALRLTIVKPFS
jgi:flagellar motor switch/type III secretory pathway protein FliN